MEDSPFQRIKQGNSSAKHSQQHTPTHQTPRQIRYPSLQGSAYSISGSIIRVENGGTPLEERFSYSRESIYATIQKPKQDDTNLLSAPLDALYNDIAGDSAKKSEKSEKSERSVRGNREIASLRKPDPAHMRQSINRSFDLQASLYQEMFEDNRNCYSDTHLLRGPVHVNYPELQRYKEESTQESIRFRANDTKEIQQSPIPEPRNSKRESFGSAQKAALKAEGLQEINYGTKRRGGILALVGILVIAIMLFAARIFVPKMFYDKRTPVIFSETEVEKNDFGVNTEVRRV